MRITIDTEREEIEEIRHAIAILEDALKRRESGDNDETEEEDLDSEEEVDDLDEGGSFENEPNSEMKEPEATQETNNNVMEPEVKKEINIPMASEIKKPVVNEVKRQVQPDIDMSALTMVDHSGVKPNRTMPVQQERPAQNNKTLIKEIIADLRNKSYGQPIQMSNIVIIARQKNISEDEARNLVSELQREGAI